MDANTSTETDGVLYHPPASEYPYFRKEYIYRLFKYICYLNDKAETRANYLIVANSVIVGGAATSLPVFINFVPKTLPIILFSFLSLLFFVLSVLSCVFAILPRTYDKGIPINHGVIGRQDGKKYVETLDKLTYQDMISHFGLEINILCKIVNTRFEYVGWAARFFFSAVVTSVLLFCITFATVFNILSLSFK